MACVKGDVFSHSLCTEGLKLFWPLEQISGRLRQEFPGDPEKTFPSKASIVESARIPDSMRKEGCSEDLAATFAAKDRANALSMIKNAQLCRFSA